MIVARGIKIWCYANELNKQYVQMISPAMKIIGKENISTKVYTYGDRHHSEVVVDILVAKYFLITCLLGYFYGT